MKKKIGNSVDPLVNFLSLINDFNIISSLEKIRHDDFTTGSSEIMGMLRDYLQVNIVSLLSYIDHRKMLSYISSTKAETRDLTNIWGNIEKTCPYLFGMFLEKRKISVSSVKQLPPSAEIDIQYLENKNIYSVLLIPVISYYKNNYGIVALSEKEKNWNLSEELLLNYCGSLLVSSHERVDLIEEIGESEKKFRIIADSTYDLERWHSPKGNLIYISPSCKRITGYSANEFLDDPDVEKKMILPDDLENYLQYIEGSLNGLDFPLFEFRITRKDGIIRWLESACQNVFDQYGNNIGLRTSVRDITDLKNAEITHENFLKEINRLKEQLEIENGFLREKIKIIEHSSGIVTRNPAMLNLLEKVKQVAGTDTPVLITGESGTGKELIAATIHEQSDRKDRLMITVNCAAIPSSLIESELFGREKGAYTGALTRQIGRFEMADKSTIFLDEIAELPIETQSKLLQILRFGEFRMLGGNVTRKVDVRIIAATNRVITDAIEEGVFRKDLYNRLNVFPIVVPPLRDRKEDIPILT